MDFHSIQTMNDNVYSFLLFTGYLKIKSKVNGDHPYTYELVIPNKEVRYIYEDIFMKWFDSYQRKRRFIINRSFDTGRCHESQSTIAGCSPTEHQYYDNYENFYHGFMVGFLKA